MSRQSKLNSFIEANMNTAIGFVLAMLTWMCVIPWVFPEMKPHADIETSFYINLIFTLISILRNYVIRRVFNRLQVRR